MSHQEMHDRLCIIGSAANKCVNAEWQLRCVLLPSGYARVIADLLMNYPKSNYDF